MTIEKMRFIAEKVCLRLGMSKGAWLFKSKSRFAQGGIFHAQR